MVVIGQRPMSAASSSTVRDRDFLLRPHPRPADILQVTPGLYVVQHAGGGKANQYFLRGFDADHGTDVALFVDGVPVNLVSHGHGQGYADLHWLIPETVERIEVYKGPYFVEYGDFATAGAINLITHDELPASHVSLQAGSFDGRRALLVASPKLARFSPFLAAEIYRNDGPFEHPEDLERYNVFAKVTRELGEDAALSLVLTSYGGDWNASGQIPLRAVRAGQLGRFGSVDPSEGGSSTRHGAQLSYRAEVGGGDELAVMAYAASHRLTLYSNFTFYSEDPVDGDMIEQNDSRTLLGMAGSHRLRRKLGELDSETLLGVRVRADLIDNALRRAARRERLGAPLVDAQIEEASFGAFAQEQIVWTSWLRTIAGVRYDQFGFAVDDRLEETGELGSGGSGVRQASRVSPKASAVLTPLPSTDVYLNLGWGYHSNDARGVVRSPDPVTPLTRALGYEIGVRTRILERLDAALALFALELDSEIVWVGDEGTTEARGPTERIGAELELRYEIAPWLFADFDATLSRARFTEEPATADAVPLAPELVLSGGLSARHPEGYFGRLGAFHLGDRAASEDEFFTAEGFTRLDATLGYRHAFFAVELSIQNLLDVDWREAQFANVSRLPQEAEASSCPPGTRAVQDGGAFLGCEDVHFTPGAPINAQLTASVFF
jgi:outer membrane receptor protein involved in Fe transport